MNSENIEKIKIRRKLEPTVADIVINDIQRAEGIEVEENINSKVKLIDKTEYENLILALDNFSNLPLYVPSSDVKIKNLTLDFVPEGQFALPQSYRPFFNTKFLDVTDSVTLKDCCFGNDFFHNWGKTFIFQNTKTLNLLHPSFKIADLKMLLNLMPHLEKINFNTASKDINTNQIFEILLKHKNIKEFSVDGVTLPLEHLSLDSNTNILTINYDSSKDYSLLGSALSLYMPITLKVENQKLDLENLPRKYNINMLDLSECDLTDEQLKEIIATCPNIKYLSINNCPNISKLDDLKANSKIHFLEFNEDVIKDHHIINLNASEISPYLKGRNKIDTLEVSFNTTSFSTRKISLDVPSLEVKHLIANNHSEKTIYGSYARFGLSAKTTVTDSLTLNQIELFLSEDTDTSIYKDCKKIVIPTNFDKSIKMLRYFFSNVDTVEFPNHKLSFEDIGFIIAGTEIKKIVSDGIELNTRGISFEKGRHLNLDEFEDVSAFNEFFPKENFSVNVTLSSRDGLSKLDELSLSSLNLIDIDISDDELQAIIANNPNLKNISLENCSNIQDIDSLIDNEQIEKLLIDDKNVFDELPGVNIKYTGDLLGVSPSHCISVDLSKYEGDKILPSRYNKGNDSLLILFSPEHSNFNDINLCQTNSISELACVNTEPLQHFKFDSTYQPFINRFSSINTLKLGASTPDLAWLSNQDCFKKLQTLAIKNSDLLNRDLANILEFKNLKTLELTNSRKITDVSVLAQAEWIDNFNLSHNRIHKGVDLILSKPPDYFNVEDNLITNKQIDFFISNISGNSYEYSRKANFSQNPITSVDFSHLSDGDIVKNITFNNCLISNYKCPTSVAVGNFQGNPSLLDKRLYSTNYYAEEAAFNARIKKVFDEINLIVEDLPIDEKRAEFVKLCKNYYSNPTYSENGSNNMYYSFLGTLSFAGIVAIEDDYYYCKDGEIVPIMEKDPNILLQDNLEPVDELDSYLRQLQIESSEPKIINFHRAKNSTPSALPFSDYEKLNTFLDSLSKELPDSRFFKFYNQNRQTLHLFEVPTSLLERPLEEKSLESSAFPNFIGGVNMKLISDKGNVTSLGIPCKNSEHDTFEDLQVKKDNLRSLKDLIDEKYFYLEGGSDADLVVYGEDKPIESLADFLGNYLPVDKSLEKLQDITPKQALLDSFNLDDYPSILSYGQDIQEEVTAKLDDLQKSISNSSEVRKVSSSLERLGNTFSSKANTSETVSVPVQKKGLFSRLFGRNIEEPVQYDNTDSISQEETIKNIKEDLKASAQSIMENVASSKQATKIIQDYVSKLNYYIDIAKEKLTDCETKGANNEQIDMLKRKIQSLEVSRILAAQTCTQFDVVVKNNSFLFERVYTATQLIPVLTSQSILRSNIDSQNDVLNANKNMYNYTEETILANAKELKQTSFDVQQIEDPMNMLNSVIKSVKQLESSSMQPLFTSIKPQTEIKLDLSENTSLLEESGEEK